MVDPWICCIHAQWKTVHVYTHMKEKMWEIKRKPYKLNFGVREIHEYNFLIFLCSPIQMNRFWHALKRVKKKHRSKANSMHTAYFKWNHLKHYLSDLHMYTTILYLNIVIMASHDLYHSSVWQVPTSYCSEKFTKSCHLYAILAIVFFFIFHL